MTQRHGQAGIGKTDIYDRPAAVRGQGGDAAMINRPRKDSTKCAFPARRLCWASGIAPRPV